MSDPLADYTNISQEEIDTKQPGHQEQAQQRKQEVLEQALDDVELPQEKEQYEATENAESSGDYNASASNELEQGDAEDQAYSAQTGVADSERKPTSSVDRYEAHEQEMEDIQQADFVEPTTGDVEDKVEDEEDYSNNNNSNNNDNSGGDDDDEAVIKSIKAQRLTDEDGGVNVNTNATRKKNIRKPHAMESTPSSTTPVPTGGDHYAPIEDHYETMNPEQKKRLELEEKMDAAIKMKKVRRRKADEDDIDKMEDMKIQQLSERMLQAADADVEKNTQGQVATEKLKMLDEVMSILSRADLAISILDNNLLLCVKVWLEPLPDASMPAYQIQKELIQALETLPIKTEHLRESNLGKVLVFYQRSKRTEPQLKKIVDRLIGDWTRPLLNRSDSYKDRSIQFGSYNKHDYSNKLSRPVKKKESKTLYEQNAERRKRAAIPTARTAAYKIAPKVDKSRLLSQAGRGAGYDERFRKLNQKLVSMGTKKKTAKKGGPSIEGRDLTI